MLLKFSLKLSVYLLAATSLLAQAPQTARFKGIWEPVSYGEDLQLLDVFFVTADVGWVSGHGGTILGTRDGGKTWTPQLGGNPASQQPPIQDLVFLDERHGWATSQSVSGDAQLFRTTDGENWEQVGVIPGYKLISTYSSKEYTFTSPTNGFAVNGDGFIRMTQDAGKTWREVYQCKAKAKIEGLTREVGCRFVSVNFPTPSVGYALGAPGITHDSVFLAKTVDGGATWSLAIAEGPGLADEVGRQGFFGKVLFTDENSGFISSLDLKIYATTDGGKTWRGVPAKLASWDVKFADPEVGWAFRLDTDHFVFSYTADAGKRWSSPPVRFLTALQGFSLPRRDRAYVVGAHGMVSRYSVVPMDYTAADAFDAPAMPGLDASLLEDAQQLIVQAEALSQKLHAAAESSGEEKAVVDTCCVAEAKNLETTVAKIGQDVPSVGRRFRNLNLMSLGLELISDLLTHANGVGSSFAELRKARDKQSALAALAQLTGSASSMVKTAQSQFQQSGASMMVAASETGPASGAKTSGIVLEPVEEPAKASAGSASSPAEEKKTTAEEKKSSVKEKVQQLKKILRPRFP